MSALPGQRSAQSATRAAVAVQRELGRSAQGAGAVCEEIGVTDADTGARTVLSVDAGGREIWTDDDTGTVTLAREDEGE